MNSCLQLRHLTPLAAAALACTLIATEASAQEEGCYESGKSGSCGDPGPTAETKAATTTDIWTSVGWYWVSGKVMPGFSLFFGELFGGQVSVAPIWSTQDGNAPDETFLGAKFGLLAMMHPYSGEWVDLRVGLGVDIYYLGGINGDVSEVALAMTADATTWLTPKLGLFVGFRGYPLASTGLELGTDRSGDAGIPLLFQTGIRFR